LWWEIVWDKSRALEESEETNIEPVGRDGH